MISLIRNSDIRRWGKTGKWVLVYGRRKTGKSFFVKNSVAWDKYFFIGKSGEIFNPDEKISYEAFVKEVFDNLQKDKTVVIDEIQRLPEEFYDRLHNFGVNGKLIALSSTLYLIRELVGKKSPLLGLFSEFPMGIVDEKDVMENLSKCMGGNQKQLVETAVYLREPWLVPLWESTKDGFLDVLAQNTKITVPALTGEIFSEEEKEITPVYEGILKSIADGKRVSGEITDSLYSLKLIPAQNPSLVHPYLKILHNLGILEKIKVFGKNKYYYYHSSPVVDLFYYLDSKYDFSDRDISAEQTTKVLREKMPLHVEQFFRNILSKSLGLWKEIISEKDYEIDIALTDFRRIKLVGEVKWKGRVDKHDIEKVEAALNRFESCKKLLIVQDKKNVEKVPSGIDLLDAKGVLKLCHAATLPKSSAGIPLDRKRLRPESASNTAPSSIKR